MTRAEMLEWFRRSLEEMFLQGVRSGQAHVLRRQTTRRFGEEAAAEVSKLLQWVSEINGTDPVFDALFECGTGEEFIERVRKEGRPKTMDEVMDMFQGILDGLVQGAADRFGEEAAAEMASLLDGLPWPDGVNRATVALLHCTTGEEFIQRVRTI